MTDEYSLEPAAAHTGNPADAGGTLGAGASGGTAASAGERDGAGGDGPRMDLTGGTSSGGSTIGGDAGGGDSAGAESAGADTALGGGSGSWARGGRGGTGTSPGGGTAGGAAAGGLSGAGGSRFEPACDDGVVKGSACNQSSVRLCYRTCGPNGVGYKSETCQFGTYDEQNGCTFPVGADYSCYQIPARRPTACPALIPRATAACAVPQCTPCFGGTLNNPLYEDSTGAQKLGYCVCTDAGMWTCAGTTSWPCPGGAGCN